MQDISESTAEAQTIFHITSEEEWNRAANTGSVTAASLTAEGFIHCSEARHLPFVLGEFFALSHAITLLYIDSGAVAAPLLYEGSDKFPHIYGTIPMRAVRRAVNLIRRDGENWVTTLKRECPGVLA